MSAWVDACVFLAAFGVLAAVLFSYSSYLGAIAALTWLCLVLFAQERCRWRARDFDRYFKKVVSNVKPVMNYAVEKLPQAVLIVDEEGRIQWANPSFSEFVGAAEPVEPGVPVADFWPEMILKPIWGMKGEYVFHAGETTYRAEYRPVPMKEDETPFMAFYVVDVTEVERLRQEYHDSRTALAYIQIDNYDEVLQGLAEAERSTLIFAVNNMLDTWAKELGCFIRRVNDEMYVSIMERRSLERAIQDKFDILDRVRALKSTNKLPVTLSIGVAVVSEAQSIDDIGQQAQKKLDLALGRGGDQVAVLMEGKTQFFGGKAQAVEKHTRVKARVVAHALRELIEASDEILIMGHKNEDFDAVGAAMGVAKMARQSKKAVRVVLSDMNDGIDKFTELIGNRQEFASLFVHESVFEEQLPSPKALLVIVDVHVPHMVASPKLFSGLSRVVIIDHHRRSETSIENPLLLYIEPSASSTSELVTELLMYYDDDLTVSRFDATALYAGIVVDTKHFAVQTGVRTLEAAAFLRRAGADPVLVRQLFREDYDTNLTIAKTLAASTFYEGGLIVARCPGAQANIQVVAAQAADAMLLIEGVRMSIVVFQLKPDTVGVSARSSGELNVQVIMEAFGGGGHQNVAGAQIKDGNIDEIQAQAVEVAQNYIKENG